MKLPKGFILVSRVNKSQSAVRQGTITIFKNGISVFQKEWMGIPHRDLIIQEISRILNKETNLGLRLVS